MSHNWALNCEKRQKVLAKNFEFLENFWSFGEYMDYFGVFFWRGLEYEKILISACPDLPSRALENE